MNNMKKKSGLSKSIIALVLVSLLCAMALASCGGDKDESSVNGASSSASSEAESSSVSENVSEESNAESSDAVFENSDESQVSEDVESSDAENVESSEVIDETSEPDDESSTTEEPEILGTGTKNDPYLMIPDENRSVTTYEIPAGESQYYSIYRVAGTILTVENEDISIEYGGFPYFAKKGKLTLTVADGLASDAILFEVINEGDGAQSFVLKFANPVGTMANPEALDKLDGSHKASLKKDNATGYFYAFSVTSDSEITFYLDNSDDYSMTVNCIRGEIPAQYSTDEELKLDDKGRAYITISALSGDELVINLSVKPVGGKYPAADIEWSATLS